jgi:hypothetical protein
MPLINEYVDPPETRFNAPKCALISNIEVCTMKIALILAALMLIAVASAEREYVQVNDFNISFNLNQTHDAVVDTGDDINGSVSIRTFEGSMTCNLFRYPKPLTVNSTWLQQNLAVLPRSGVPAEQIEVDNSQGVLVILMSNDTGKPIKGAFFYPDMQKGEANAFVSITSTLPFYTTADLLRTIQVTV